MAARPVAVVSRMKVSVVIPTRDRGGDLRRCLAALATQSLPRVAYEVIICDDGSTEAIEPIAREFGAVYVRQEPKGPAAARNLGIARSRAPIVAMTDSDTVPDRDWLAKLLDALDAHPDAVAVEGKVFAANEGAFDPLGEGPSNASGGVYLTCNCAYRREVLLRIGGFDESFPYPAYEDTELAARAQEHGRIVWQPEALVQHPQRPLTARAVLKKLRHWEYVLLMGYRYGYLAWRQYPVRHPRLRVALLSVIALPLAKWKTAASWFPRKPLAALHLAGLGLVESVGALVLVAPRALLGNFKDRVVRRSYLS
jgi:glycosyltransferase involved in cell wall biosynthesis